MTKIIAMIPARAGSERLKLKNLRLLCGKPVVSYCVEAAQEAGIFDEIYVNSEHPSFSEIANRHGVKFHLRPEELGSSEAQTDDFVAEFMREHPGDILVLVNPPSPLQTGEEIKTIVGHFIKENLDSLVTVKEERFHAIYDGKPINFSTEEKLAKTQNLKPVQVCVYSILMWRYETFLKQYDEKGFAFFSGNLGYYPIHSDSSIALKYEKDLEMAEALLRIRGAGSTANYDPLADKILGES